MIIYPVVSQPKKLTIVTQKIVVTLYKLLEKKNGQIYNM